MTCAGFRSILMPEDNGKQNSKESYTTKYQKLIVCSYSSKIVCVDDKFLKHTYAKMNFTILLVI